MPSVWELFCTKNQWHLEMLPSSEVIYGWPLIPGRTGAEPLNADYEKTFSCFPGAGRLRCLGFFLWNQLHFKKLELGWVWVCHWGVFPLFQGQNTSFLFLNYIIILEDVASILNHSYIFFLEKLYRFLLFCYSWWTFFLWTCIRVDSNRNILKDFFLEISSLK